MTRIRPSVAAACLVGRPTLRAGAVVIICAVLVGCSSGSGAPSVPPASAVERVTSAQPSPTASPTSTVSSELPPIEGIPDEQSIHAEPDADWVAITGDIVWVAGVGGGIGRFDGEAGADLEPVSIPGAAICLAMDTGFESVWAGDCNNRRLLRIDATTGDLVASIALPAALVEEGSVATGDDGIWAVQRTAPRSLVRVDPVSESVAGSIPAPEGAIAVRAGFRSLWVTDPAASTVHRIDPADGMVLASIVVGRGARFLTVGEGAVWTLDAFTGTVTRIDPTANAAVATIPVSGTSIDGGDIAVGGGSVWARVSDSLVARIDPATNTVTQRLGRPAGSGSVAANDAAVWISAHDIDRVFRVPLQ